MICFIFYNLISNFDFILEKKNVFKSYHLIIIIIFLTSILSGLFFVRITRIAEKKYCEKEEELKTKGKKKTGKGEKKNEEKKHQKRAKKQMIIKRGMKRRKKLKFKRDGMKAKCQEMSLKKSKTSRKKMKRIT